MKRTLFLSLIPFFAALAAIPQKVEISQIPKGKGKLPLRPPVYSAKEFDLSTSLIGLSENQIDQHKKLYEGYVNKRNLIAQELLTVDKSDANATFSPYRALKIEETYAGNGDTLHRLYFENLGGHGTTIGNQMEGLINESFGSLENFKKDLYAAAKSARGWVLTAYNLDDGRIHNYVLEAHNKNVPVLAMPLLVLDVYEHAYMIDFGINRPSYLDVFWTNIDWDIVEKRIDKWVNPFRAQSVKSPSK